MSSNVIFNIGSIQKNNAKNENHYHRVYSNAYVIFLGFVLVFYMLLVRICQENSMKPKSHLQVFRVYLQILGYYFQWR